MNRILFAGLMLLGLAVGCKKAEEQAAMPAEDQMAAPAEQMPAAEATPEAPAAEQK